MGKLQAGAELLADKLDLPADAAGAAKITLYGRRRLLIENHKGILNYGEDIIEVDCGGMKTVIRGNDLSLGAMDKNDMLVTGRVLSIELE